MNSDPLGLSQSKVYLIATNDLKNELVVFSVPNLDIVQVIPYGKLTNRNIFSPNQCHLTSDGQYLIANMNGSTLKLLKNGAMGNEE